MKHVFFLLFWITTTVNAYALNADTSIELRMQEHTSTVVVDVYIDNPSKQEIRSVASYLSFDTDILKRQSIAYNENDFPLQAPPNPSVKNMNTVIPIERSSQGTGVSSQEIHVASITFEILKRQKTEITFFNYSVGNNGNVVVFSIQDGHLVNILKEEPKPLILFQETSHQTNIPSEITPPSTPSPHSGISVAPTPLITGVQAGRDFISVQWKQAFSDAYLYYGTKPGEYLFRKNVSNVQRFTLDNLSLGKQYYVQLVFGESSTPKKTKEVSVLVGKTQPTILNKQIASGPEFIIVASILLSLAFVFRKKICYNA